MKKPGELQAARKRHLRQQRNRDALKQLREGKTVWMTVEGRRIKVAPLGDICGAAWLRPYVLARCPKKGRGSKLIVGILSDKNGFSVNGNSDFPWWVHNENEVLGQVVEQH